MTVTAALLWDGQAKLKLVDCHGTVAAFKALYSMAISQLLREQTFFVIVGQHG